MMQRSGGMPRQDAETLALSAFAWVIAEPELRDRFLAMTGWQAEQLRDNLANPAFLAGVLDWLLAHEPTLLRYCAESGQEPERPALARAVLAGPAQ